MAVRCGRCGGSHESAAGVRECYNGGNVEKIARTVTGSERATDKQIAFAASLAAKYGVTAPDPEVTTRREFSGWITSVQNNPPIKIDTIEPKESIPSGHSTPGSRAAYTEAIRSAEAKLEEGGYALKSRSGNNDFDFIWVDKPTAGRWAGYTFVSRYLGGQGKVRISRAQSDWFKTELGALDSAARTVQARLFGQLLGICTSCGRELTDEASRALGIGPVCRSK